MSTITRIEVGSTHVQDMLARLIDEIRTSQPVESHSNVSALLNGCVGLELPGDAKLAIAMINRMRRGEVTDRVATMIWFQIIRHNEFGGDTCELNRIFLEATRAEISVTPHPDSSLTATKTTRSVRLLRADDEPGLLVAERSKGNATIVFGSGGRKDTTDKDSRQEWPIITEGQLDKVAQEFRTLVTA